MSIKINKITSLMLLSTLIVGVGCQNNNLSTNETMSKSFGLVSELKDILPPDKGCEEKAFSTKQEINEGEEDYSKYQNDPSQMSHITNSLNLSPEEIREREEVRRPRFDINRPIQDKIQGGEVSVVFKDEAKVRIKGKKSFLKVIQENNESEEFLISVTKQDMSGLNKVMKKYDAEVLTLYAPQNEAEENELTKREKENEELFKGEYPNAASIYTFRLKDENVRGFVEEMRKNSIVLSANYAPPTKPDAIPNDPIFTNGSSLSGITANEIRRYYYSRIKADKAWDIMGSAVPAQVAVIDYGFKTLGTFEDKPNYDTDKRTYCDSTPYLPNQTNLCSTGSTVDVEPSNDTEDHGTQVASIIGAKYGDGNGFAGMGKNVSIVPVKVNSSTFATAKALLHIRTTMPDVKVINISMSTEDNDVIETVPAVAVELEKCTASGIVCVITPTNKGVEISNSHYTGAIVVGGVDKNNQRWNEGSGSVSGYGARIDIAAPASDIMIHTRNNEYSITSGTSFSAPMVAATAALIIGKAASQKKTLKASQVRDIISYTGTPIYSDQKLGPSIGNNIGIPNGRVLDMYRALELSTKINNGKKYIRAFNIDSIAELKHNNNILNRLGYKDDYLKEMNLSGTYSLHTYNTECTYSWGYQIWDWSNGVTPYVSESIGGIAGKLNPASAVVRKNQWISPEASFSYIN